MVNPELMLACLVSIDRFTVCNLEMNLHTLRYDFYVVKIHSKMSLAKEKELIVGALSYSMNRKERSIPEF